MRAPAPWPPPPYETGDPIIRPERDANIVTSPPDPPPADTDPAYVERRPFAELTDQMKKIGAATARAGASMASIGGAVRAAFGSAREFDRALGSGHMPPPRLESERVYTEAEVSEFDRLNEALRETGEDRPRYWWRKVGDRYRQVIPRSDEGFLVNEDGQPLRLAEERPIGIAVTSAPAGGTVTVQVSGVDENGRRYTLDGNGAPRWDDGTVRAIPSRLPADQRPHPGPPPPLSDRGTRYQTMMQSAARVDNRTTAERNASFPDGMTDEEMASARRPAQRPPSLQVRLRDAMRVHNPNVELFEQLTREGYDPLNENNVTDEALASSTLMEARYELEFRRWRRTYNRVRYPATGRPPIGPVVSAGNRQDEMQDAIVAALRGVARDPRTDSIGNGVTQEQLQNATTAAQRYDVLWRAGLIDGRYAGPGAAPEHEPPLASRPVVPEDPRKRRLRVRT